MASSGPEFFTGPDVADLGPLFQFVETGVFDMTMRRTFLLPTGKSLLETARVLGAGTDGFVLLVPNEQRVRKVRQVHSASEMASVFHELFNNIMARMLKLPFVARFYGYSVWYGEPGRRMTAPIGTELSRRLGHGQQVHEFMDLVGPAEHEKYFRRWCEMNEPACRASRSSISGARIGTGTYRDAYMAMRAEYLATSLEAARARAIQPIYVVMEMQVAGTTNMYDYMKTPGNLGPARYSVFANLFVMLMHMLHTLWVKMLATLKDVHPSNVMLARYKDMPSDYANMCAPSLGRGVNAGRCVPRKITLQDTDSMVPIFIDLATVAIDRDVAFERANISLPAIQQTKRLAGLFGRHEVSRTADTRRFCLYMAFMVLSECCTYKAAHVENGNVPTSFDWGPMLKAKFDYRFVVLTIVLLTPAKSWMERANSPMYAQRTPHDTTRLKNGQHAIANIKQFVEKLELVQRTLAAILQYVSPQTAANPDSLARFALIQNADRACTAVRQLIQEMNPYIYFMINIGCAETDADPLTPENILKLDVWLAPPANSV